MMLRMINNRRAQSAVEYSVLIVIVLAVFLSIGTYFKRGVQGRWKMSVDDLGDQYDPRYAITNIEHRTIAETQTTVIAVNQATGWWTHRVDMTNATDTKTGSTLIGAY